MQIVRTTIANRIGKSRGIGGLVLRAAIVGGCAMFVGACNTDRRSWPAFPTCLMTIASVIR